MTSPMTAGFSGSTQVAERVLRRIVENPYGYPYMALGLAILLAGGRRLDAPADLLHLLLWCGIFAIWLPIWVKLGHPTGPKGALNIGLAVIGSLIQGYLMSMDLAFAIVALALITQYFLRLQFIPAILCGLPPVIGSEVAHRMLVLANPDVFPLGAAIMRFVAVMAIGVTIKLLVMQNEERSRLQASLAAAERKSGVLEERQRLAREIHDTLAQGFAGIVVHLETAEQIDPLKGSAAKPHLDLARSVAREGLDEARRMLQALRPEILAQRGLTEALDRVCDDWSKRNGLPAFLEITGSPAPMHPDIELTILRAVQEGLNNIRKHAEARSATVTLSYMEDMIVLDVQDDGKGFVPSNNNAAPGNGFGLAGMRERTEALQGSFSIESVPGEGSTISITLPVLGATGTYPVAGGSNS